jgi:FecR-like protein
MSCPREQDVLRLGTPGIDLDAARELELHAADCPFCKNARALLESSSGTLRAASVEATPHDLARIENKLLAAMRASGGPRSLGTTWSFGSIVEDLAERAGLGSLEPRWYPAIGAALLAAAAIAAIVIWPADPSNRASGSISSASVHEGRVRVGPKDVVSGARLPLGREMTAEAKTRIVFGPARIVAGETSRFLLGADLEAERFVLEDGTIAVAVDPIAPAPLMIVTPAARITVLGATVRVQQEGGATAISVEEGQARVVAASGETRLIRAGESLVLTERAAPEADRSRGGEDASLGASAGVEGAEGSAASEEGPSDVALIPARESEAFPELSTISRAGAAAVAGSQLAASADREVLGASFASKDGPGEGEASASAGPARTLKRRIAAELARSEERPAREGGRAERPEAREDTGGGERRSRRAALRPLEAAKPSDRSAPSEERGTEEEVATKASKDQSSADHALRREEATMTASDRGAEDDGIPIEPANPPRTEVAEARAMLQKDARSARALAEKIIATRPSPEIELEAMMIAGDASRRSGDLEPALHIFLGVAEDQRGEIYAEEALLRAARIQLQLHRPNDAFETLARARPRFPRGPLLPEREALTARVLRETDQIEQAARVLEDVPFHSSLPLAEERIAVASRLAGMDPARAARLVEPIASSKLPIAIRRAAKDVLRRTRSSESKD